MLRRIFFPMLLGLAGVAVLVSLGFWQLRRMEEKAAYLSAIETMIGAEPVTLKAAPDPATDKFRPVTVEGRFTGQFLEVLAGQKGASPGVRVIEAFETSEGRRLLVDRGFLMDEARATPRPPRAATVTGNLHWPDDADSFTPPPDAATGLWFSRDVAAMAQVLDTEATLIVAREQTGDGITPVPVDTSAIPNDHWGYAIQWFLMAAAWAGMTGYLLWRTLRRTV